MSTRGPSRVRRAPARFRLESMSESDEEKNAPTKKGSAKVKKSPRNISQPKVTIKTEPTSEDEINWFNDRDDVSDEDETYALPAKVKKMKPKTAKIKTEPERAKKKSEGAKKNPAQSKMKVKLGSKMINTGAEKKSVNSVKKNKASKEPDRETATGDVVEKPPNSSQPKNGFAKKSKLKTSLPSYPFKISKPIYNPNIKYYTPPYKPPTVQKENSPQSMNTSGLSGKDILKEDEDPLKKYPCKVLPRNYRYFPQTPRPQIKPKPVSQPMQLEPDPDPRDVSSYPCKLVMRPYRERPAAPVETSRANNETQQLANQLLRLANQTTADAPSATNFDMDTEMDVDINNDDIWDTVPNVPSTPASNTVQTIGISNTFQTPGSNSFQTPGSNNFQTPGSNSFQAPSSNTFQTPGSNTLQTPASDTVSPMSLSRIKMDPDEKPFKCKYCTKKFKLLGDMISHEVVSCKNNAFSQENFNQDEYEDNSDEDLEAPPKRNYGHDKWVSKSKYRMPTKTVEKLLKKNPQFEKIFGRKPDEFPCKICGKIFFHKNSLQKHEICHKGERPWCCTYCGKSFITMNNLKCHERIHTGEKPYECKYCGNRFTQLSTLKSHERTHTGEKTHQCKICHKMFSRQSALTKHDERKHQNSRSHMVQPGEVVIIETE